ncbi:TonB-dependent receptor [Paracoccus sp. S-4012]|uniref:TonB-dependent receptor plug domain-containing protein n=1 Tax=Paracoccus sp. S-4012 TaxID=2665648 RepID=UPI0012B0D71B|nr:TonB-dependent receptor [Paracoccus sp. S-4012]MRX51387.1 TonB-dependent receptor [Paracoccus sp. S-4012]
MSRITLAAAISLATAPALAQDMPEALPPIVISGGLTPVPQDEYGRAATVLSGEALRATGAATVAEALTVVPGLTVNATDLSDSLVRIRGHRADLTLILIDGVEQIADLGGTRLGGLDLADIDRIEVLRGPQAASMGAGAAAGVLAIWTRRGAEGLHYGGAVEAGGATGASVWASQRGLRGGLSIAAAWRDDRGWDVSGDGGEKDGLERRTLRLSGDFAATDDITMGFSLRAARDDYRFDTTNFAPTSEADYILDDDFPHGRSEQRQGQLWAEWRMAGGSVLHRLGYDLATDERESVVSPFYTGRTETERRALRYRLTTALDGEPVELSTQVLSVMAERVEDDSPIEPLFQRATNSLALEYRGEVRPGVSVQVALRRDFNDSYRDATSWNAALAWVLPESGVKLHASAGDGTRKPAFYELYGDGGAFTLPNPGLAPERNRSVDVGVTVPFADDRGSFDVTVFRERLTDRIVYEMVTPTQGIHVNDAGTSPRQGVEASLGWRATDQLSLRGHATLISSRNAAGERELRVPQREVGLGATWTTADGRGSLSGDLRHVAGVMDTDWATFTTVALDSYTLLDVSGRWTVAEGVALTARVDNLTDADHSDAWGYAGRGRTAYVGLSADF